MHLRIQYRPQNSASERVPPLASLSVWLNPAQSAILVCDMWDKHWCASASRRVEEMAPFMNGVLKKARSLGFHIIHSPSDTLDFYAATPQRQSLNAASVALSNQPISPTLPQWDRPAEPKLPIDDSDGGCDDTPPCPQYKAWTRQHAAIEIYPEDTIADQGREVFGLCALRGIQNILIMGVHTNMCVLGRSFGIRAVVQSGLNAFLVRDLTDTMYNPRSAPFVSHFEGTAHVIAHIETYCCPTLSSAALTGESEFLFQAADAPK